MNDMVNIGVCTCVLAGGQSEIISAKVLSELMRDEKVGKKRSKSDGKSRYNKLYIATTFTTFTTITRLGGGEQNSGRVRGDEI